jgi:hypothetical protein
MKMEKIFRETYIYHFCFENGSKYVTYAVTGHYVNCLKFNIGKLFNNMKQTNQ